MFRKHTTKEFDVVVVHRLARVKHLAVDTKDRSSMARFLGISLEDKRLLKLYME